MELYEKLDMNQYAAIGDTTSIIHEKVDDVNKQIEKINKKILEIQKLIPNYKIGDTIITKNLRIVTIKKIDYKKKLGFLYGGTMNFQVGDGIIWFNEDEFLEKYKGYDDYEYKLVRRVKELENEIELMKRK